MLKGEIMNFLQPTCYMLMGCPGSGKTTWVRKFYPELDVASTDNYVEQFAAERGLTYNDVFKDTIGEATSRMLDDVRSFVSEKKSFVWDQTNMSVKSRKNKFRYLVGYNVAGVVFETPEQEELDKRLMSRQGKTIPQYVLQSMIENYEVPTISEGFTKITLSSSYDLLHF